jgi:hypothetical protein
MGLILIRYGTDALTMRVMPLRSLMMARCPVPQPLIDDTALAGLSAVSPTGAIGS